MGKFVRRVSKEIIDIGEKVVRAYIMMATYNGAAYVEEQIRTILDQKDIDVTLRICDDGSTDETVAIVDAMAKLDPRIRFTVNDLNKGVRKNFLDMLLEADSESFEIFGFADQDDVWLEQKLIVAYEAIERESKSASVRHLPGFGKPILYCSDLENFYEGSETTFRELEALCIDDSKKATFLIRNYFSGCTMVFNADMLRLLQLYVPDELARIHDSWLTLVGTYVGSIHVDWGTALIKRRNHGGNAFGAITSGTDFKKASVRRIFKRPDRPMIQAASELLTGFRDQMTDENRSLIEDFVNYPRNPIARLRWACSSRYQLASSRDTALARIKFLFGRF